MHLAFALDLGGNLRNRRLLPAVLLLAAFPLALAGCSGGTGPAGQSTSPPPSSSASASLGTAPPTERTPAPPPSSPGDVSTSFNAIGALRNQSCTAASDGSWTFKGTLVNDTGVPKTYTVAVAVTIGAAVQGHALITETVQPGKSADVSAKDFAHTTGRAGSCEPVVSAEDAK